MSGEEPINADVRPAEPSDSPIETSPDQPELEGMGPAPSPSRRRRLHPVPGPIKLVVGLVAIAIGFIVLAVTVGGGGSGGGETVASTTTTAVTPPVLVPAEGVGGSQEGGSGSESEGAPDASAAALAYPALATDNTTRIAGSDPASIAAAAALAIFPSTSPDLRPAAVTIAPEDPRLAIAAAVMMAPPIRAPLLLSAEKALPTSSSAALQALAPAGSKATDGVSVYTVGDATKAPETSGKVDRATYAQPEMAAATRAIAELRERATGEPPDAYLLAPLDKGAIAAPAAAWAARSGDPVLHFAQIALPEETAALLEAHPKIPVFVIGPKSAIPDSALAEVEKIGNPVKRVAGKSAVASAIAFARYRSGSFGWDVNDPGHGFVLARADEPLSAAAASALSAAGTWGPLLLTDGADTLPGEVRDYLLDVKPGYTTNPTRAFYNHIWIVGDEAAISVRQQAEANGLAELAQIGGGE